MERDAIRTDVDRRVPPLVLIPQLAAPLVVAGDPITARLAFILAVLGNVPVALAGRVADTGALGVERSRTGHMMEWARPCAAWAYALLLTSILPYVEGELWTAAGVAALAGLAAGALAYVAPGASTPAGLRLHNRQAAGIAWHHEAVVFTASRTARLLGAAAVALSLAGQLLTALMCLWGAVVASLLAYSLRPRNAVQPDPSIRDREPTG